MGINVSFPMNVNEVREKYESVRTEQKMTDDTQFLYGFLKERDLVPLSDHKIRLGTVYPNGDFELQYVAFFDARDFIKDENDLDPFHIKNTDLFYNIFRVPYKSPFKNNDWGDLCYGYAYPILPIGVCILYDRYEMPLKVSVNSRLCGLSNQDTRTMANWDAYKYIDLLIDFKSKNPALQTRFMFMKGEER